MTNATLSLLTLILFLSSCKKEGNNCSKINSATIFSNGPVTLGQTIHFGTQEVGGNRNYIWYGPQNFVRYDPEITIGGAKLTDQGWYYLNLNSVDAACQKIDSVFIKVNLLQGTPSCSIPNNSCNYSALGTDTYTTVTKRINTTFDLRSLEARGNFPTNLTIYFHPIWHDEEPEDGIYTTGDSPLFDLVDPEYNKVFITTTQGNVYWGSRARQNVYVSHVNGKLQVRFCNLNMSGNNGSSFSTTASGNIIEN